MQTRTLLILTVTALVALAALVIGWFYAGSSGLSYTAASASTAPGDSAKTSSTTAPAKPAAADGKWVPPEGDPVDKYRAAKTAQERYDVIANFMALGHERNPAMLIDALRDADLNNRIYAVESASALTPEEAREVYRQASVNDQADVREMTWSLVAPHPMENKVYVYQEPLARGSPAIMEEAFHEMGVTPERPLFEMMLTQAAMTKEPQRAARIMKEINEWLVPGGGTIPQLKTPAEALKWWESQSQNYDEFMLRVDQ
ncbi:MAG: hypothetical protein KDK97_03215 [Verrucomicrobiales bacterium]|nr:hypothetical protein [Verrucomicrobiales bacterium]MCP5556572.1 hypothetical protein [Verrucomicrobiaceae bacterium]